MDAARPVVVSTPDEVLARAATQGAAGERLLVLGQTPVKVDDGWADRVLGLDVAARPRVIVDAWVRREHVGALAAHFATGAAGGCDAMFATAWRWAWGGAPFRVWSRRGVVARVDGPARLALRTLGFERHVEVARVRGEVTAGWVRHRVGVVTAAGAAVWIARRTELGPVLDVTYDGLNLLADASWVPALGQALARALGVSYEGNDVAVE